MNSKKIVFVVLFAVFYVAQCNIEYEPTYPNFDKNGFIPDLVAAASGGHQGHGRVQIKVYRGPSEGHEKFAPHGYWVKQPADHHHHH